VVRKVGFGVRSLRIPRGEGGQESRSIPLLERPANSLKPIDHLVDSPLDLVGVEGEDVGPQFGVAAGDSRRIPPRTTGDVRSFQIGLHTDQYGCKQVREVAQERDAPIVSVSAHGDWLCAESSDHTLD